VVYSTRVLVLRDRAHVAELTGDDLTPGRIVEAIAADGGAEGAA
jgi:simple sugar transport system ATP-binding protein